MEKSDHNIGRGGSGANRLVFTLLDWTNSQSVSARRIQYQIMGGQLNNHERLTKGKWKTMVGFD